MLPVAIWAEVISSDLRTRNAFQPGLGGGIDGFALKLDPARNLIYATYIGGSADDLAFTAALDGGGHGYVAGTTGSSNNFPLKNPIQGTFGGGSGDMFLLKLDVNGQLLFSTYLGGNGSEFPGRVSVDPAGNVDLTGNTGSTNFTQVASVQGTYGGGATDAFVMQINTLVMASSDTQTADVVALGATPSKDGIINIPGPTGTGIFGVATSNVGATSDITVTADTGDAALPVNLFVCQTNPVTGDCLQPLATSVTLTIAAGATPTFGLFAQGTGNVPFNPGANRAFIRFKQGTLSVGATSAALRTQ